MKFALMRVFFLWMLASAWRSSLADHLVRFHRVLVSNTTLMTSRNLEYDVAPSGDFQHHRCSQLCHFRPWCDLWCSDTSGDQCLFSDLIVMPFYEEKNVADALDCYTRRHRDFATGASIDGTHSANRFPTRVKDNLVDGIYNTKGQDDCYKTAPRKSNHWFVLDFGRSVAFNTVKMFPQTNGSEDALARLRSLEVRVGMAPMPKPGDFSSYEIFGNFVGPATEFGQEIVIETPAPVKARFLSVQKIIPDEWFQICHLEVY